MMSRSGYSDDCDGWALIRWRGAVASAIRGERGQKLLRDLAAALDAMPVKALVSDELVTNHGEVCALGALGCARGMQDTMRKIDPEDREAVASAFNIAPALAAEIVYENDDWLGETPEHRWLRMRRWVGNQLKKEQARAEYIEPEEST
jgi:hypothetical protein